MKVTNSLSRVYNKTAQQAFRLTTKRRIRQLLASGDPIFLELGAGPRKGKNGWVTSDLFIGPDLMIDLLKPLPFPDNTIDMVYASHVLEHFSIQQIENILMECGRVLKLDGMISLCVPDAAIYIDAYQNPESFNPAYYCRYKPAYKFYSKIDYINYVAYMDGQHFHLFDQENLIAILCRSGFREVKGREFDPELDRRDRDHTSLYIQGLK
ncbi:MAG: class I SAM-dependent methyltransferase [Anaerolineales bacterium]|jgi:predicted SAM-dependent methyltransferase